MLASRSLRLLSPWCPLRRCLHLLIPPGVDSTPSKTSEEVIKSLTEDVIGGTSSYDPQGFRAQREKLMALVPASQEELPERRMRDSFDQVSFYL